MSTQQQSDAGTGVSLAHLEIVHGIHKGVSIPLESNVCRIGSDTDSDILLNDADVGVAHVIIRVHGRKLAIEAAGGDVTVNDRLLVRGTGCRVQLPVTMKIGKAELRLHRPGIRIPVMPPIGTDSRVGRFVMMTALALTLFATTFYQVFDVKAGADIVPQTAKAQTGDTALKNDNAVSLSKDDVIAALNQRLTSAGLSSLTATGQGQRINVAGRLGPDDASAWNGVRQWFDRHYGTARVLTTTIDIAAPARPNLELQAVWLGDHPYIIDGDGKRRHPGSAVADGWTLETIDRDRITLSRGDHEFALTL